MLGDEGERDAAAWVYTAERVVGRSLADLDGDSVRLAGRAVRDGVTVDWRSLADQGPAAVGERGAFAAFDASGAVAGGVTAAVSEAERRTLLDGADGDRADRSVIAVSGARRFGAPLDRPRWRRSRRPCRRGRSGFADRRNGRARQEPRRVALVDRDRPRARWRRNARRRRRRSLPLAEPLRGADATEPAALGGDRPGYVTAIADFPLAIVATPPGLDRDPRLIRWGALCATVAASCPCSLRRRPMRWRCARRSSRRACPDRRASIPRLARPPHRHSRERLHEAFVSPSGERAIALLVIDLDRFKYINDTHGHPIGDELLRVVADRLRALAGPADLVGRLGGDEFGTSTGRRPWRRCGRAGAAHLPRIGGSL